MGQIVVATSRARRPAPAVAVVALLVVILALAPAEVGVARAMPTTSTTRTLVSLRESDVGTPWTRTEGIYQPLASAGGALVAQGPDGVYAIDADLRRATLIRSGAGDPTGLLASDGTVVISVGAESDRAELTPLVGGASATAQLPPHSSFVAAAASPGRAWFVTAANRIGTATTSVSGFGPLSWVTLPGSFSSLAAAPDGTARVTTDRGMVLSASPGGPQPVLTRMATVAPVVDRIPAGYGASRRTPVAVAGDGLTYVGTATGLARIGAGGRVVGLGGAVHISALAIGPNVVAYDGTAADGEDDAGFYRLDDGSTRVLPRPRLAEGIGGNQFSPFYAGLVVTGSGRLCTVIAAMIDCASTQPRWTPSVTETVTRTRRSGQPILVVRVAVSRRPAADGRVTPAPTGRVRIVDDAYANVSELGNHVTFLVATAAATLVDGRATVVLPVRPSPNYSGYPLVREVFAGYAGDARYGPNNSTNWHPPKP